MTNRILQLAVLVFVALPSLTADWKATDGAYFVVNSQAAIVLTLENNGKKATQVLVDRFGADGAVMDSVTATVDVQQKKTVRLEPHKTTKPVRMLNVIVDGVQHRIFEPERSWIRVLGKSIVASASSEHIDGDQISLLDIHSLKAHSGHVKISDTSAPGEYTFVNASDAPVHVGICREQFWTGLCNPAIKDVVPAHALIAYPIERGYVHLASTERCVFVTSKQFYSAGTMKTFGTDTSITFDRVR